MSIEIDVLNGDASWTKAEPLMKAVWPRHVVERLSWGHIEWANADLRVLIDAPEEQPVQGLACHVGIFFRTVNWDIRALRQVIGSACKRLSRAMPGPIAPSGVRSCGFRETTPRNRLRLEEPNGTIFNESLQKV